MSGDSGKNLSIGGFETFSSLLGTAQKNLEKLKSRGMEEYGLSGTHTLCLRQLYEFPEGLTRTQLSHRLGVDRAQVTRVIGELLSKNFVEETEGTSNYRKKCYLTPKGKEITAEINGTVSRINAFVSGDIPEERLEVFYSTLSEICDNLIKAEELL